MAEAVIKVAGGKMLRVYARIEGNALVGVRVTGDFFLHPEEAIERVEAAMEGAKPDEDGLVDAISAALGEALLIGASPRDIAVAVMAAAGLRCLH